MVRIDDMLRELAHDSFVEVLDLYAADTESVLSWRLAIQLVGGHTYAAHGWYLLPSTPDARCVRPRTHALLAAVAETAAGRQLVAYTSRIARLITMGRAPEEYSGYIEAAKAAAYNAAATIALRLSPAVGLT